MDMIQVTHFTMDDYDDVAAFWREQDGIGLNESDERGLMVAFLQRNPGMSLVVRDRGRVVGAVLCSHDGRRGYLHHLAVAPSHRQRGIGRLLVERCLDRLHVEGVAKCNIYLFVDNVEGARFWHAVGFVEREDLKVLQKTLPVEPASGCSRHA